MSILRELLGIEELFCKCRLLHAAKLGELSKEINCFAELDKSCGAPSDDQKRYLKMAMKIDSRDAGILHRKKNIN